MLSITDPGAIPMQFEGEYIAIERLIFQDFNSDDGVGIAPNAQHAAIIRAFARQMHELPEEIEFIVHCKAGISRSAAVARWVSETYGVKAKGKPFNIGTSQANTLLLFHLAAPENPDIEQRPRTIEKKPWSSRLLDLGRRLRLL